MVCTVAMATLVALGDLLADAERGAFDLVSRTSNSFQNQSTSSVIGQPEDAHAQ